MTISYDGRSSTMRHLIEAMLSLGAKIEQSSPSAEQQMVKESLTTAFDELPLRRAPVLPASHPAAAGGP